MQTFQQFYIISESTRRGFLKQLSSAVLGSTIPVANKSAGYDVTNVMSDGEFIEYMVMNVEHALAAKMGLKSWKMPDAWRSKVDKDVKATLSQIMKGIIPKSDLFMREFALYSTSGIPFDNLDSAVKNGLSKILKGVDRKEFDTIARYIGSTKAVNYRNIRDYIPAKDIIVSGKVVVPAKDFIRFGFAVSPEEAARNIANITVTPEDVEIARAEIAEFNARGQQRQNSKSNNQGSDDKISYTRFDTAGGNEDDDYKLALDSFKTPKQLSKIIK